MTDVQPESYPVPDDPPPQPNPPKVPAAGDELPTPDDA